MAAVSPPLGTPESAVVAAFERVDLATADPMAEIVDGHVDPDRSLADHAFAHALLARAGVTVTLSAGPLVVGPDLARGIPSDPPTRAGRALALQALSVAVARGNGVPDGQLLIGALPPWIVGEPQPAARAAAEVAIRRELFPGLSLAFAEPLAEARRSSVELWSAIVAAIAPPGPLCTLVLRRSMPDAAAAVRSSRMSAAVAADLDGVSAAPQLAGIGLEHARATVAAAVATLERLANDGWRSVLGEQPGRPDRIRLGADTVAERTEAFDPFEDAIAAVG
jgi:hypothetical protein